MEQNLSFRNTLIMVNTHRIEEEWPPDGRNVIMNALECISSTIDRIQNLSQGNTIHKALATAWNNQTKRALRNLGIESKS